MPENSLWKLIKQSWISHSAVLLIGALCAVGGSYLAIRDTLNAHDYRITAVELKVNKVEETVGVHHMAAGEEKQKISDLCSRLTRMEDKIDKLLMREKR